MPNAEFQVDALPCDRSYSDSYRIKKFSTFCVGVRASMRLKINCNSRNMYTDVRITLINSRNMYTDVRITLINSRNMYTDVRRTLIRYTVEDFGAYSLMSIFQYFFSNYYHFACAYVCLILMLFFCFDAFKCRKKM